MNINEIQIPKTETTWTIHYNKILCRGDNCVIASCSELGCNIGMILQILSPMITDTEVYLLPVNFTAPDCEQIAKNGRFIGTEFLMQINNPEKYVKVRLEKTDNAKT